MNIKYFLLFLLFIPLLIGCKPETNNQTPRFSLEIAEGEIGGKKYFVPEAYFKLKGLQFAEDIIYLQTMYPDFLPLTKKPIEYWREGEQWRSVSILAKHYPNSQLTNNDLAQNQIDFLKTFEVVGEEYGLIHQKQPNEYIQDHRDIWIEKHENNAASFITCSEKLIKNDRPQCAQQYYLYSKFHVKINFDKRLLPHWKTIDFKVRELFKSFESPETAQTFLQQQISLAKSQKKENDHVEH